MSNEIRHYLKEEVQKVIPHLHKTYRIIGTYQKNRNKINKRKVLSQLKVIAEKLKLFKEHVQYSKQAYFDIISDNRQNISDRIISLDIAVGAMHIEFPISRSYSHQESKELREALDRVRFLKEDEFLLLKEKKKSENFICKGIGASPGIAVGKAKIIKRNSEYKRLPKNTIVVTKMTRPEIIIGIENIIGIVTDIGGSLCHAAIISRELRIPCVVGTKFSTTKIKNNSYIRIDGTKGIVEKAVT